MISPLPRPPGAGGRPPRARVASLFQACLGGIFLAVFASLAAQLPTLIGRRGLLPIAAALDGVADPGLAELWGFPTLFWLARSDAAIRIMTWAGITLSILLALGIRTLASTFLLWLLFLSCITAGRDFFQYQWDNLLLEASFLALFLPAGGGLRGLRGGGLRGEPAPPLVFLFRWLTFRLLFESALAKLVAGSGSWLDLSAMTYYYETAPLPSWGGWLVQQAPRWFHQGSALFTFLVELALAPLAFAPRPFRRILFAANAAFQASIFLTANYGYFNLLSLAISLFLLDDRDLEEAGSALRRAGGALRRRVPAIERLLARLRSLAPRWMAGPAGGGPGEAGTPEADPAGPADAGGPAPIGGRLRPFAARGGWALLVSLVVACSLVEAAFYFVPRTWEGGVAALRALAPLRLYAPLRIVNVYHLFPGVLRERVVVEVNGTLDGASWRPYRFRYTPGDSRVAPPTTWLHNPRFAFHYSFLPLNRRRDLTYFNALLKRLCCDPGAVASLIAEEPFPGERPRALRFDMYRYRFGDRDHLRRTGEYWAREFLGTHEQLLGCRCEEAGPAPPAGAPPPAEPP